MKILLASLFLALSITGLNAQTEYFCRLKKDCRGTNMRRENINIQLRPGDQYPVLGTSGKMTVIKIGSEKYYVANGCIDLYKTGEPSTKDTAVVQPGTLPEYK
jgi:hypothetical protein